MEDKNSADAMRDVMEMNVEDKMGRENPNMMWKVGTESDMKRAGAYW